MTEGLRSLEKLRADAVDQARSALAQERALLARADALVCELAAQLQAISARSQQGHASHERATVADYAWAERVQRAARSRYAQVETRLQAAQTQRAQAHARVLGAERRLLDAELGRRAVGHVVAQRDAARAQELERRIEEDAADAHRARPR